MSTVDSKFAVPGDELWVYDEDGNVIQRPTVRPLTKDEQAARERSKAAIERIKNSRSPA